MLKLIFISVFLTAASAAPQAPDVSMQTNPDVASDQEVLFASNTSMQTFQSKHSFEETIAQVKQFIEDKGLTLFAEIDHAKGAEEVGLTLEPATVIIFGNPKAGTLLMQDDINIAVDLPLKILVFVKDGNVMIGYRTPSETLSQYNLSTHRGILNKMDGLFMKIVDVVRVTDVVARTNIDVTSDQQVVFASNTSMQTFQSQHNFEDTIAQVKQFFDDTGLTLFAEIDHAKGAKDVGLTLEPTTVIIFGNPKAGTILMQDDINIAVDLPLKVLLFVKDGKVMIGYRTPSAVLNDYNISSHRGVLNKMDSLFMKIVDVVRANNAMVKTNVDEDTIKEVIFSSNTSMQTFQSQHNFDETITQIKQFIQEKGLTLFAEIDHAKGAEEVGLTLEPTTVIIFGNPKAGTLLMQDDINIAIDLPLKVLVFVKDGKVMIGYRTPSETLNQYNLNTHRGILNKMDGLLMKIVDVVRTTEE